MIDIDFNCLGMEIYMVYEFFLVYIKNGVEYGVELYDVVIGEILWYCFSNQVDVG